MTKALCRPMPEAEYHADKTAWSKSMLWDFVCRRSKCYATHFLGLAPPETSKRCFDLGDLAHAAILEPHRLESDYIAYPASLLAKNGAVSTNAAKEFRDSHEAAGRVVMKQEDFDIVAKMVESVRAKLGQWLKAPAKIEHAIYWTDGNSGLRCRCRPDFLVESVPIILDVKTTDDVTPAIFKRRVETLGYWLQDVHYSAGIGALLAVEPMFLFVVVESEWPHQCAAFELSQSDKFAGREYHTKLLDDVAECMETGDWSDSWEEQIIPLYLNDWTFKR